MINFEDQFTLVARRCELNRELDSSHQRRNTSGAIYVTSAFLSPA